MVVADDFQDGNLPAQQAGFSESPDAARGLGRRNLARSGPRLC